MSWNGRMFKELGRKMLSLKPLALQAVHPQDSVLGSICQEGSNGLRTNYAQMIREAFVDQWVERYHARSRELYSHGV